MRIIALAVSALLCISATAQIKNEHFKNLKPRNIGPAGMSGRVTAIDALYTNPDVIFVGAASGGVWKTVNGGATWTPLFDEQPLLNIGSLKIQQSNPDVIWVGTGEGNPRNSLNLGEGIYKTLDGGKTWKRMGLEKTRNIHRVLIDPTNPDPVRLGRRDVPVAVRAPRRGRVLHPAHGLRAGADAAHPAQVGRGGRRLLGRDLAGGQPAQRAHEAPEVAAREVLKAP